MSSSIFMKIPFAFILQRLTAFIVPVVLLSSCAIQNQIPFYLQNAQDSAITKSVVPVAELRIQSNDILAIEIASKSIVPEKSDQLYNQEVMVGAGIGAVNPTFGYLVDKDGNIQHHRLGTIHVAGLTRNQLAEKIRQLLTSPVELLTEPTVKVRFVNFRVNVLGQVGREGPVSVNSERLTIMEAIALAGGITDFGRRDNVRVIREENGKRNVGYVDLTRADFYNSEYYNLTQNDMILVEPNQLRYRDMEQNRINQRVGLAFSMLTVALTLITLLSR
jgi:polysaccharide export outer membrane protein